MRTLLAASAAAALMLALVDPAAGQGGGYERYKNSDQGRYYAGESWHAKRSPAQTYFRYRQQRREPQGAGGMYWSRKWPKEYGR